MNIDDSIKIKILKQGGIIINHGRIVSISNNFVALEIDLKSKHGEIEGEGSTQYKDNSPCIILGASPESIHLKKGKETEWTLISFPNFKGYYLWCSNVCRYTLRVCLIKKD